MPRFQDAFPLQALGSPFNSPLMASPGDQPPISPPSPPPSASAKSAALLASARAHRAAARNTYKLKFRQAAGTRAGARGKISKEQKLRMNRESAEAGRYADKQYCLRLEHVVQEAENQQEALAARAMNGRMHRDALAEKVLELQETIAALQGLPSPAAAAEEDVVCCTRTLLERNSHIPELRMTPTEFAEALMGPLACPAL